MKSTSILVGTIMTNVKKNIITIIVGGIVASTAVLSISQVSAFERGKRGGGASFQRMDTNLDGTLSLDEITLPMTEKVAKMLTHKDTDEDGSISFEEYNLSRGGDSKTDLSAIADDIVQCVADVKAETNDDNITVPSADQFLSPQARFDDIDTNIDGLLSLEELQAKATAKGSSAFDNMDADDNGEVSEDEFNTAKDSRKATRKVIRQCISEINEDAIV